MSPSNSLRAVWIGICALVWVGCTGSSLAKDAAPAPKAAPTSAEAFLRIPAVTRAVLSPDGRRIAGLAARDGVQVVFEMPRTGGKVNFLSKIDPETVVHTFGWSGNGVLL